MTTSCARLIAPPAGPHHGNFMCPPHPDQPPRSSQLNCPANSSPGRPITISARPALILTQISPHHDHRRQYTPGILGS